MIDDFSSCGIFQGQYTPTENKKKFDFSVSNVDSDPDKEEANQTVDYSSFLPKMIH